MSCVKTHGIKDYHKMTKDQFIGNYSFWDSYKPLLWKALEETEGDIIELGMGDGSTEKLHDYCQLKQRDLFSYESSLDWYKKFEPLITGYHVGAVHKIEYVGSNWQVLHEQQCGKQIGVLFSDEAPGEQRKYNISMFCNTAQVIIAHDCDESTDHGYKYSLVKPLFKYHKLHEYPGASTIALSNFIDVSKWTI